MQRNLPTGNLQDLANAYDYTVAQTAAHLLRQCNGHISRANILRQAANLRDVDCPCCCPASG
jgi:branched-chain amino acid transport system substrate-binding protein